MHVFLRIIGSGDPGPERQGDIRGGRRQKEGHSQLRYFHVAELHYEHSDRTAGPQGCQYLVGRGHAQVHGLLEERLEQCKM